MPSARPRFAVLPVLAALAGLSACDQPKARGPGADSTVVQLARLAANSVLGRGPGVPPPPAWAAPLIGRRMADVFPARAACQGNMDKVSHRYLGYPKGVQIFGWGWVPARGQRLSRVVLVDASGRIAGAGEGGAPRADVPAAVPAVRDPNTGWVVNLRRVHGPVSAFGLVGEAACPLGRLEF
jgi:hypothetical protein